jgi:hypothetical protein
MKLTAAERVNLLNILPEQGNFITLKIVNDLRMNLSFTEKEIKVMDIKVNENTVTWNENGNKETDVLIGEKATDIIVEKLSEMDKNKQLTMLYYSLYEKFVKA